MENKIAERLKSLLKEEGISAYNIDFGIFNKYTFEPLVMIELNDITHKEEERKERDSNVIMILQSAGIPLITINEGEIIDEVYMKKAILEAINVQTSRI